VPQFARRSDPPAEAEETVAARAGGPTIVAELGDGPLDGRRVDAEVVEGRPPKTIEVEADDGGTCRYCLAEWNQGGATAEYTFLYRL
jgi:hypothetical protein